MTRPLRATSITPASLLQRNRLSAAARIRQRGNRLRAFHSLWVGKAGGELLRGSPPLSGASVLSASRLEPLAPFPLASPARISRSIQEPGRASRRLHAGCRLGSLRTSPKLIPEEWQPSPVLTSSNPLSTRHRRFACARLSPSC